MQTALNDRIAQLEAQLESAERKADILSNMLKEAVVEYENAMEELTVAKQLADEGNRAKSAFLANVSHEIRTPMNAIIGLTNLTLKTDLTPAQKTDLMQVRDSSLRLLDLINDILDFSKIEAGKLDIEPADFNLDAIIEQVASLFREKIERRDVELFFLLDEDVPLSLHGDGFRITQVLTNLVSNAVKFTEKGRVVVRISRETGPECGQVVIRISVSDTGIGIAKDKLDKLFTPFTQADGSITRQYGGTGLGLSICSCLVELMHGSISMESRLGQGSTFHVSLPLGVQHGMELVLPHNPWEFSGRSVLFVENSVASREIITDLLTRYGFAVESVSTFEEGLCAQHLSSYDLVLVDYPSKHTRGLELLRTIGKRVSFDESGPKTLILTVKGLEEAIALDSGKYGYRVDGCLFQPLVSLQLRKELRRIFSAAKTPAVRPDAVGKSVLEPGKGRLHGAKILLVEDNHVNQMVATALLRSVGAIVDTAENGEKAVELALQRSDYDAVLMDIQMPVMDGYVATGKIREQKRDLPIIAMTAHALKDDRAKCLDAGMNDYVSKPVDEKHLFAVLLRWIGGQAEGEIDVPQNFLNKETPWLTIPQGVLGINIKKGLDQVQGNTGLYKEVLRESLKTFQQAEVAIRQFPVKDDGKGLERVVHSIKGVAGNIGAMELFTAASELNSCQRDGIGRDITLYLNRFEKELGKVTASLLSLDLSSQPERKTGTGGMTFDKTAACTALDETRKYLEMSSAKARHSFLQLKNMLCNEDQYRGWMELLGSAIYQLDTDTALAILAELEAVLAASMRENTK